MLDLQELFQSTPLPINLGLAACSSASPDEFFQHFHASEHMQKKICAGCEIKDDCLEYSLEAEELFGVWGGAGEVERRRMIERRQQESGR